LNTHLGSTLVIDPGYHCLVIIDCWKEEGLDRHSRGFEQFIYIYIYWLTVPVSFSVFFLFLYIRSWKKLLFFFLHGAHGQIKARQIISLELGAQLRTYSNKIDEQIKPSSFCQSWQYIYIYIYFPNKNAPFLKVETLIW